jgi:hypothetical protein
MPAKFSRRRNTSRLCSSNSAQTVLHTHRRQRQGRRTGVNLQATIGIGRAHQAQVIAQGKRQILAPPQSSNALPVLGKLGRLRRIERISDPAPACVSTYQKALSF